MAKVGLILSLHVIALCFCLFGLHQVFQNCSQWLSIIYTGLWFVTAGLANLAGVFFIVFCNLNEKNCIDLMKWSNYSLQYYFLIAWISCIVGYPTYVSSCWMEYSSSYFVHVFSLSSLIPLFCWIFRKDDYLSITTQAVVISAIAGQLYVSFLTSNFYCSLGALFMVLNLLLFSVPQDQKLCDMSPKDGVIISCTVIIYCLAEGVYLMRLNNQQLQPLKNL